MKTISEQLKDLENTRAAKAAQMQKIMEKSLEEGRSTDTAEGEEFDTIEAELGQIDADIVRLKKLEAMNIASAKAAAGGSQEDAANSRAGISIHIKSSDVEEKFKGQNYVRQVIAKAVAQLESRSPISVAVERWGKTNPTLVAIMKANEVEGGNSASGSWGAELVQADTRYTGDFIEYLYAQTVYDRLGLRVVPANVAIKGQDGAGTGYWVGESKAIPATALDFSTVSLTPLKVAALAVVSNELLRDSTPAAESLVRDALVNASSQRVDATFMSTTAASGGVSPAGMMVAPLSAMTSSGTDGAGLRNDIKQLYAPFIAALNSSNLTLVMNPALAKSISLMVNALGQTEFPGIGSMGGTLLGDPVVTGDNVNANWLVLLKPSDIYRIGDLGVQVSISRDAMIEQATDPTGDTQAPTAASKSFTSMFQSESTAIKVVRPISFAKRRASAVQYVSDADYGATAS